MARGRCATLAATLLLYLLFSKCLASTELLFQVNLGVSPAGSSGASSPIYCLPLGANPNVVSIIIDWGDGTPLQIGTISNISQCANTVIRGIPHTYTSIGVYNITVDRYGSGPVWLDSFGSRDTSSLPGSRSYTSNIEIMYSFGDLGISTLDGAFDGAAGLLSVPSHLPPSVTSTVRMFRGCTKFNQNIESWNVSRVTNMESMFEMAASFNARLNAWDVSNVESMIGTFKHASSFNQPLDKWIVAKVKYFNETFAYATSFNQILDDWNVSSAVSFRGMFYQATKFNAPLTSWDVSKAEDFSGMFYNCSRFNQALDSWNLVSARDLSHMFDGATNFNADIRQWNVYGVTTMRRLFARANKFNQPLGDWNVSHVRSFAGMFEEATRFNHPILFWNTSSATSMSSMFRLASSFDQAVYKWNTSSVEDMSYMFANATSFGQTVYSWNVGRVSNMDYMFFGALSFREYLKGWCTYSITREPTDFADPQYVEFPRWGGCYIYSTTPYNGLQPFKPFEMPPSRFLATAIVPSLILGLLVASFALFSLPFWNRPRRIAAVYVPLEDIGSVDSLIHSAASQFPPGMTQLPPELWGVVFDHCPDEAVYRMMMTSTRWHKLRRVWPTLPEAAKRWKSAMEMCQLVALNTGILSVFTGNVPDSPTPDEAQKVFTAPHRRDLRYLLRSDQIGVYRRLFAARAAFLWNIATKLKSWTLHGSVLTAIVGGMSILSTSFYALVAGAPYSSQVACLLSFPLLILTPILIDKFEAATKRQHLVMVLAMAICTLLSYYGTIATVSDIWGYTYWYIVAIIVITSISPICFILWLLQGNMRSMVRFIDRFGTLIDNAMRSQ